MACTSCENVAHGGPTQEQQFVDAFAAEELPYLYTCRDCDQTWWRQTSDQSGPWMPISKQEALAIINRTPSSGW